MKVFSDYNHEEQQIIVKLGLCIFAEAKKINNKDEVAELRKTVDDFERTRDKYKTEVRKEMETWVNGYREENSKLQKNLYDTQNKLLTSKEQGIIEGKRQSDEYVKFLNNQKQEKLNENENIKDLYSKLADEKVELAVARYKEEVMELMKANKGLRDLYIHNNKGGEYEKVIVEEIEEYNNTHLDSIWDITHVGQSLGHKGDIVLIHKETKMRAMIDCKNHDSVPKEHRDKFICDMENKHNNYDIGLMVSRGKIKTKKKYEENDKDNKKLVYISDYCLGNPGFIFVLLERFNIERQNNTNQGADMSNFKTHLEDCYNETKKQKDLFERQLSGSQKRVDELTSQYNRIFGEDIAINSMKVRQKPVNIIEEDINYDEIENNKTVKGERSKFYIITDNTIQYYKNKATKTKAEKQTNNNNTSPTKLMNLELKKKN
jgi:hypothetical protein